MTPAIRGAAFTAGAILTVAGGGVLLGYTVALAAETLRDLPALWIAAGMVALGVPLLVWGSRTDGGTG